MSRAGKEISPEEFAWDDWLSLAKMAEKEGQFEEMLGYMRKVNSTVKVEELTAEECEFLCTAYKNVIEARLSHWFFLSSLEQEDKSRGNSVVVALHFRDKVEAGITKMCQGALKLLDTRLVPAAISAERKAFYLMLKGNYCRCLIHFKTEDKSKDAVEDPLLVYKSALDIALADLAPTHPTRLELALTISTHYYEFLNSPVHARNLAKQALDEATAELDTLGESKYKDTSTLIVHFLRRELTLWSSDISEETGDEIKEGPKGQ